VAVRFAVAVRKVGRGGLGHRQALTRAMQWRNQTMKRTIHGTWQALAMLLVAAMTMSACHSAASGGTSSGTAAQTNGEPGGASYVSSAPLSSQTTTFTVPDPSFNNMTAETLTIPAGWQGQGMIMTAACTSLPWPVFRAYSNDGLMQMRYEPVFGWVWRPNFKGVNTTGCIPVKQQMTAAQFLQYYVGTIQGGVHVVGAMQVPANYQQWAQNFANSSNAVYSRAPGQLSSTVTADTAALRIETIDGSYVIEERLRTVVLCTINNNPGPYYGGTCWSRVDVLAAPQGKLDALVALADGDNLPNGQPTQQWEQAVLARQRQQSQQAMATLRNMEQAEARAIQQQFQQFASMMNANHAAFMQQQESQFQTAMANANAQMNAQSTAASDWVDYALDQQTVAGPGGTANVSSAYSETWTNGTQYYQTNDPNVNPNGVLAGNWARTTQVHGNGQPK